MFDLVRLFCLQGTKIHLEHLKNKRYLTLMKLDLNLNSGLCLVSFCLLPRPAWACSFSEPLRSCPCSHSLWCSAPFSLSAPPSLSSSLSPSIARLFPFFPVLAFSLLVLSLPPCLFSALSLGSPLSLPLQLTSFVCAFVFLTT